MDNRYRPSAAAAEAFLSRGRDLLVTTDAEGRITWRNAAFDHATGRCGDVLGCKLADLVLPATDPAALQALQAGFDGGLGASDVEIALGSPNAAGEDDLLWCLVTMVPFDDRLDRGFACVLHDHRHLRRQRREAQRLEELLDMAQEFGRLGVWERDIATGEGHWDRHVFRFFDMDPSEGTPNHKVARSRVHPEDRDDAMLVEWAQTAGRYSRRYRVVGNDGAIRVIHSQWEVKAGSDGAPSRAIGMMVDDTEAYEMARSLTQANARLELAVELSGIGLWRHDLVTNLIHYDHQAFRILGLEPRAEGMSLDEVRSRIHPDDIPVVVASAKRALESDGPTDMEARYRHRDGSWRVVMTRRAVERDADGKPIAFIGVGLDVTDRVESARVSVELARRLEAITRAAGLGAWSVSLETGDADWDRHMFELFDLPPRSRPPRFGAFVRQHVHAEDQVRVRRDVLAWLRAGHGAFEIEFRTVLADGTVRWILGRSDKELRGAEQRLYGIAMEVTERKRTEAALQEAGERVALAARGAGIGTWAFDPATGATYWDEQMFLLRGLRPRPTALTEQERLAITHPDDRQRVLNAIEESLRTGEGTMHEFRIQRPDGQWRWLASRSIPIRDSEGRIVRQTGVNWDVTEAKTNELERHERVAAQRENQAKSQFLARISHELRTPLNAVLGFSQLMINDPERVSPEHRRNVEHIHGAGEHLLSLINDVLDLSSLQSGELKMALGAVALARTVAETLPLLLAQARARGVSVHVDDLDFVVWADITRVRQIVINLVSNAIKYNREGGHVHISARLDGARVLLSVRDTGRGIHADQIRHLFEPFNRLGIEREGIEGTGIGLAVVKAVVERMGGQVSARSELGVGSEFTVTLESARERAHEAAAPQRSAPTLDFSGRAYAGKLLYIEDNPVNVLIVEELVTRFPGLTLVSEGDGASGVARAREFMPDLVLVDMQLPDFDGFEVLRRLRADPLTAATPCIALSANAMPDDIARALAAGMADYWTKPIDFRAFADSLDRLFLKTLSPMRT